MSLISAILLIFGVSSTSKFRATTTKFSDAKENAEEQNKINSEINANIRQAQREISDINSRPDDEYQFLIHRQINPRREAYRELIAKNSLDLKLKNNNNSNTMQNKKAFERMDSNEKDYLPEFNPQEIISKIKLLGQGGSEPNPFKDNKIIRLS